MNIILLSGGSGKRLWPLSNDVRSKQFIKLFKNNDEYESMVQRVYRQITTVEANAKITIATSKSQASAIKNQLGEKASICVEPCRRDTFPAIALAAAYLHDELGVAENEAVVVCPVDPYVDNTYSHYHIPESNLVVTYNAVNQNFRKLNEEELNESELRNKFDITGNRIILSVGNLQPRKNLPRLMRAFVKLKKDSHFSDVQLVVVGKKAWMFDDIMKESADNNKDIILTDYVSNEDLVRLYNLADGFVYPSFYEGFGIPPLEAMACGTPVAVANATSLPEVVGDAGMYFDPFSEEEITNSIVKLLDEDKAIRDEKRIERVNCFNWQDSANAMFSKYIEVVGNN